VDSERACQSEYHESSGKPLSPLLRQIAIITLILVAVSTRLLPISISQYPFNNDGITEARISNDILGSESLSYPANSFYVNTHSAAMPAYNVCLAFASSTTGIDPYYLAQAMVAVFSILCITGIYLLGLVMTRDLKAAFLSSMVLSLFGTFVFLTGSTWKPSLGVALLMVLFYAYVRRNERRMLIVEILILSILPLVHHVVTVIAYLSIAYLTLWSLFCAVSRGGLRRRHIYDVAILLAFSLVTFLYYQKSSLDRLTDVSVKYNPWALVVAFVAVAFGMVLVLSLKRHAKWTFAPVPATVGFVLFLWDWFDPIFPYSPGAPNYAILLAFVTCFLIGIAWLGFESIVDSNSRYRAIPLGMLAPVLALLLVAVLSGPELDSHQILYRTYDFADPAIAVGVALTLVHFRKRVRAQRLVIGAVLAALLISFPFAYATGPLIGVRHDTQAYEVEAFDWLASASSNPYPVQSDERLGYLARALRDFEKLIPTLPYRIVRNGTLGGGVFYVLEDEWMSTGVNDYPHGHPALDSKSVNSTLESSNVYYVGGPPSNNIVIFESSRYGREQIFGSG